MIMYIHTHYIWEYIYIYGSADIHACNLSLMFGWNTSEARVEQQVFPGCEVIVQRVKLCAVTQVRLGAV